MWREGKGLQLMGEAFNLLNSTNFSAIQQNSTSTQ